MIVNATNIRHVNHILIEDQNAISELMNSNLSGYDKVIVLGSTGMLGYYLTSIFVLHFAKLTPVNHASVVGVSRSKTEKIQKLEHEFPRIFKGINFDQLDKEFEFCGKILVVHAASPSSIQAINDNPHSAVETNVILTIRIANLLEKHGGHIVFLSSGEIYGDSAPVPTAETDFSPINHLTRRGLYPIMKKSAEAILNTYCERSKKISATSLRVFHTFGPGLTVDDPRIFGLVCRSIHAREEIALASDGSAVRVFLYSRDLMSAILYTIGEKGFNVFNVAGKAPLSITDFCKLSLMLGVPRIVFGKGQDETPRNTQIGFANTEKLEALGWSQGVSVLESLRRTSESFSF